VFPRVCGRGECFVRIYCTVLVRLNAQALSQLPPLKFRIGLEQKGEVILGGKAIIMLLTSRTVVPVPSLFEILLKYC
jgi:hypothetical protein